jgi:hypothetical protein
VCCEAALARYDDAGNARPKPAVERLVTDRDRQLREQAEAVCVRRTAELERLRSAAPMGFALEALAREIQRLRRTPCPTMEFDPLTSGRSSGSIRAEIEELDAESFGSDGWRAEVLDVLTCALHLVLATGDRPDEMFAAQAAKLRRRLDVVDAGGTWAEAKAAERLTSLTRTGSCVTVIP